MPIRISRAGYPAARSAGGGRGGRPPGGAPPPPPAPPRARAPPAAARPRGEPPPPAPGPHERAVLARIRGEHLGLAVEHRGDILAPVGDEEGDAHPEARERGR